jgi:hypothetical protein
MLHASISQSNPNVFFLCQIITQTISIPAGHAVLVPVLNWNSTMGIIGKNDLQLLSVPKEKMDVVSDLEVAVNGVKDKRTTESLSASFIFVSGRTSRHNILCLFLARVVCIQWLLDMLSAG